MSTSGITISGLASGIDTASILTKLMALAARPKNIVQNKSDDDAAKKSVISTLTSKLTTLKSTLSTITDSSLPFCDQKTVTTTNTQVADATVVGSHPTSGSFALSISQLASAAMASSQQAMYTGADRVALAAVAQSTSGINAAGQSVNATQALSAQSANLGAGLNASGSLLINGTTIAWDDSMSLNQIMGAINNSGAGVTATFDAVSQKFSLTANTIGSSSQMSISESSGNFLDVMNITAGTFNGTDAVTVNSSAAFNSSNVHMDRTVSSGTFTLNGVVFNVDAATDTLENVLGRINNSNAGVTAVFNAATGQVSLSQKNTGANHKIVLGAAGDTSNILYALKLSATNPPVGAAADTISGTDALVAFNGGAQQSFSSNTVSTLIPGITVDLKSIGDVTLNSGADVDGMMSTMQTFVSQYNDVMAYINTKLQEQAFANPSTATERVYGTFVTDANFIETKDTLVNIVSAVVPGLSSSMNQLAQIGITTSGANFGQDANLELDETKLRSALTNNPDGVAALFNHTTDGIMTRLDAKMKSLTNSVDGTFTVETKEFDAEIATLATQLTAMQARLDQEETRLQKAFAQMESLVSQLQNQGNTMTQMTAKISA